MVTNNVTVYQFEVGLDEVFADEVRFHVNVDCVEWLALYIEVNKIAKNHVPYFQKRRTFIAELSSWIESEC